MLTLACMFSSQIEGILASVHHVQHWIGLGALCVLTVVLLVNLWRWPHPLDEASLNEALRDQPMRHGDRAKRPSGHGDYGWPSSTLCLGLVLLLRGGLRRALVARRSPRRR